MTVVLSCVCGERLQWARIEQEFTMRWIREHGGPSLAYQSEVERGKKDEVRSRTLEKWLRVLNVTETFARGQLRRYADNPAGCRGIASDVLPLIVTAPEPWPEMPAMERARTVLTLVARHSEQVPRVVLAYMLNLPLKVLDEIVLGSLPVPDEVERAVVDLTTLPETFLESGRLEAPAELAPILSAINRELRSGRTVDELVDWLGLAAYYQPVRLARARKVTPARLLGLLDRYEGSTT